MKETEGVAYWNYQLTRVLTQKQYNKLVSKFVKPAQNELYNQYIKNMEDTDKKIAFGKENPISLMETSNEKNDEWELCKLEKVPNGNKIKTCKSDDGCSRYSDENE